MIPWLVLAVEVGAAGVIVVLSVLALCKAAARGDRATVR